MCSTIWAHTLGGIKILKAQQEGFLYMDVLASLFVMSLLCSTLFVLMMSSIQQYGKMMEEDRTLQAMILYMEEGKSNWANGTNSESDEPPSVGTTSFQRIVEEHRDGIQVLTVIAYRHGEEIHRFTTYLLESSQ